MISFSKYNCILWDFDGVLMDSMAIREQGFSAVLSQYPEEQVTQLLQYHRSNGGLSRYVKFRYFFETIRQEDVSDHVIQTLADRFSTIMMKNLLEPTLLIKSSVEFVKRNHQRLPMHIVSGSDGAELRSICKYVGIDSYFRTIEGSPTPKSQLVRDILTSFKYEHVVLIGDSMNDFDAANRNKVDFVGFNNPALRAHNNFSYVESFDHINF